MAKAKSRAPASSRGPGIARCPKCESDVEIFPQCGGRGSGELTTYAAECGNRSKCTLRVEELGSDGTRREAVRHWNRVAREMRASTQSASTHK